jgi:hypothetical protein
MAFEVGMDLGLLPSEWAAFLKTNSSSFTSLRPDAFVKLATKALACPAGSDHRAVEVKVPFAEKTVKLRFSALCALHDDMAPLFASGSYSFFPRYTASLRLTWYSPLEQGYNGS